MTISVLVVGRAYLSGSRVITPTVAITHRELLRDDDISSPRADTAHHSFDPASLEIIDRLNRIMSTQEDVLNAVRSKHSNLGSSRSPRGQNRAVTSPLSTQSISQEATQAGSPQREVGADSFGVPSSNTSPDNVLMWPIFLGNYTTKCLQDAIFLSKPSDHHDSHVSKSSAVFDFEDSKVPELIERFFHLVHVKNPVVDPEELRKYARRVVEYGLSWDEGSCLVVSCK